MSRSGSGTTLCDPVTEEAIAWFARAQSDERTRADEDRFHQWLKQDPRHEQAYARIEQTWRIAGPELMPRPLHAPVPKQEHVYPREKAQAVPKTAARYRVRVAAAAVLSGAVVLTGFFLYRSQPVGSGTFATAAGVQRELKLVDGSIVVLNTRSEVTVDINSQHRSIWLTRGEARFKVAKDTRRPFTVDAGAARVRALGTAFDVRLSNERLEVTLVEGRVQVMPSTAAEMAVPKIQPAVLEPGQQLSFDLSNGRQQVQTVSLRRADAWLQRQLIFDAVPLTEAVAEANRYLPVPIGIEDPALAQIRISGVARAGNLQSFVAALESSFPVEALEHPDGHVTLTRERE